MNGTKLLMTLAVVCLPFARGAAAEWQWSVTMPGVVSAQTDAPSQAFLWIPPTCRAVNAVVIGTHNMTEETLFENALFREGMAQADMAIVWITPGWDMQWNVESGCQAAFERMMEDLADASGYDELRFCPVVPLGHSAMATYPWNFAAFNPERTLAVVSLHGDAPRTNLTGYGGANIEWGRTRNIDGIPGLMIEGEYEWWEARVNPALAFRMMYPESCVSFLCDAGRGHFDVADRTAAYIALFLQKALAYRLPERKDEGKPVALKRLNPKEGWLAERWRGNGAKRAKPAPYFSYKGDAHDAFWYFDEEMARLTEEIYRQEASKPEMQYIGIRQNGAWGVYDAKSHVKITVPFLPDADGLTFHLNAVYTDSTHVKPTNNHALDTPVISRICGPVSQVDDTTFTVSFYRMGMYNKRRSGDIYLLASSAGDARYKSAVQEFQLHIPYRNTGGKRQHILFPDISDVAEGTQAVTLRAVSDCGLPVGYYVKEGPAEVKGDSLIFTPVPPRAKFPLKVTVTAWQYGLAGTVQTAEPVERSFYIIR